ncbi:MAG: LysR family transcriptional regulator [Rhodobacterales bacterium]|nr:MAG: LysR family transcriptional regulator [Rhodobacterales bacterium]
MRPRRFLPSVQLLLAFDAVVRHGSATAAAQELNLTQSTISRLIRSLEAQLGKQLFQRQRRRLIPTSAAIAYQKDIAKALDLILRASMGLVTNPDGGTLALAVLPTFATRWLGPRLSAFLQAHPGISVNLATRLKRFDFEGEAFDAAICFGVEPWPGVASAKLFDEKVTACVSPSFAAAHRLKTVQDVQHLPLLHLESRPLAWADWFEGQGIRLSPGGGMVVDQFSMMIQAAISGLGVALLPHYLAEIEIAEHRLVPVLTPAISVRGAYWLVWPEAKPGDAPLKEFRNWLMAEATGS